MTPEEEKLEQIDQEVLSYGFAQDFEDFLFHERLFERADKKAATDSKAFLQAFIVMLVSIGTFWGLVLWRILR